MYAISLKSTTLIKVAQNLTFHHRTPSNSCMIKIMFFTNSSKNPLNPNYFTFTITNNWHLPSNLTTPPPNNHQDTLTKSKKWHHTLTFLRIFAFLLLRPNSRSTQNTITTQHLVIDFSALKLKVAPTSSITHSLKLCNLFYIYIFWFRGVEE